MSFDISCFWIRTFINYLWVFLLKCVGHSYIYKYFYIINFCFHIIKHNIFSQDIKVYAVQCNYRSYCEDFYQYIAARSFGYYMRLSNINEVKDLLMKICFREAGLDDVCFMSIYLFSYFFFHFSSMFFGEVNM